MLGLVSCGDMREELKELWRFRELLFTMVQRDLRIRYKNSVLGFFWSLLNPLITVIVMTLVFKSFLGNNTPNYSAYILASYLPYMFFQLCLLDSAQSILTNLPIIRKIYLPREVFPISSVISNFVHQCLALVVFFLYLLVVYAFDRRVFPLQAGAVLLPVLLVINLMLTMGLSFIVSALNTFYEDVKYIVSVLLYLMFFLCPIMYFSEAVYQKSMEKGGTMLYTLYHLNPVAMLSVAYRKLLLAPQPVEFRGKTYDPLPLDWGLLGVTALTSFLLLVGGYALFNRLKWRFVERP
jgi:ABC-type polysaccharide/polyol phosphate export permease